MSATTTADEKIESVRANVRDAVKDLREFLDPETWGSGDYSDEFIEEVEEVYLELCRIKKKLK